MITRPSDGQRGRPFEKGISGNPAGRPRGARNQTTLAVEALLDGEAEKLTRKAIELALDGDLNALRLCLDRVMPPRRERGLEIELSPLAEIYHAKVAAAEIVAAVANGSITLSEAADLAKLVEMFIKACDASEKAAEAEVKAAWAEEDRRDDRDRRGRMGQF